jgi:hypothetical protein
VGKEHLLEGDLEPTAQVGNNQLNINLQFQAPVVIIVRFLESLATVADLVAVVIMIIRLALLDKIPVVAVAAHQDTQMAVNEMVEPAIIPEAVVVDNIILVVEVEQELLERHLRYSRLVVLVFGLTYWVLDTIGVVVAVDLVIQSGVAQEA